MKFTVVYRSDRDVTGLLNVLAATPADAQWSTVEYLAGRGHVVESASVVAEGFSEGAPTVNALS
jgi:hypothetical protein